jgi:calcineurin-like phosphoesterase family protein
MIEIIHVSDLHLGKTKDWTKKAKRLLKNILEKFPEDINKDTHLLITGDIIDNWGIAKNLWKDQYKLAEEILSGFRSKVSAVPGNHDYGLGGFGYTEAYVDYFDNFFLPALGIGHRFKIKRPFKKILDDGKGSKVLLIALNSCLMTPSPLDISKGEIGEQQRAGLNEILGDPANKDVPKIVCLHHIPHRRAEGIGMSLNDYKELMAIVKERVDALAFGHEGAMKDPSKKRTWHISPPVRPMRIR